MEFMRGLGPWKGTKDLAFAKLSWVALFSNKGLLDPLGYISPVEHSEPKH